MKVGIMQPYFFPYLGYFQLINCVDKMVIYDNIKYTKKGWINRNRYLLNGSDKFLTIPLQKDSDFLDVCERKVAKEFDRTKLKKQIQMAYKKAPYFEEVYSLFCKCVDYEEENLFNYIYHSIKLIMQYMEICTELIISSHIDIDHNLKAEDKVLAICKNLAATEYINPIGGVELYHKEVFAQNDIQLKFIQMNQNSNYKQFLNEFVPGLSILDVLMFNSINEVKILLQQYQFC